MAEVSTKGPLQDRTLRQPRCKLCQLPSGRVVACYANEVLSKKGLAGVSVALLPGDLIRSEGPRQWSPSALPGGQVSRAANTCLAGVSALSGELASVSWATTPNMEPAT